MKILLIIFVMFLVSYLPRMLPLLLVSKKIENKFVLSFLHYLPYAVISVLVFPSILEISDNFYLSLIGMLICLVLSLFIKRQFIVTILAVILFYLASFIF